MTNDPDLTTLNAARFVRNGDAVAESPAAAEAEDLSRPDRLNAVPHPYSIEQARAAAESLVGMVHPRTLVSRRSGWWDRLRAATTPEERLSCERMINALGRAIGLHQHEAGAALVAHNLEKQAQQSRQDDKDREQAAIDAWR